MLVFFSGAPLQCRGGRGAQVEARPQGARSRRAAVGGSEGRAAGTPPAGQPRRSPGAWRREPAQAEVSLADCAGPLGAALNTVTLV